VRELNLRVAPDGTLTAIYDDALAPLFAQGDTRIKRASYVEPNSDGRWTADLAPVGGPTLGPFDLRQDALHAELDWLRVNLF